MNDETDENGTRPRDFDAHRFVKSNENENENELGLVRMVGGTLKFVSLTHYTTNATCTSTEQRALQLMWRGTRIFGLLLAFMYIVEVTYCSSARSSTSTTRSCDRFPFALITFCSCLGVSLTECYCILFVLVTLRTLVVTAKDGYLYYREEQMAERTISTWDYFVKYWYQQHVFDYKEETIVQRATRIANKIAQEIWRSAQKPIFLLMLRALQAFRVFESVLRFFRSVLWFFRFVLNTLFFFMSVILVGVTVATTVFLVFSVRIVLGITILAMLQFQIAIEPTVWLVCKILHF
jgi:hypothetical protein